MKNVKQEKGFSLIEAMAAVGVLGVVSAIAVMGYQIYLPKTQSTEAFKMIESERISAVSLLKVGVCEGKTIKGRYGTLTASGVYSEKKGGACPSGCKIQYKFNASGVQNSIKSKVVDVNLLNNGQIPLNTTTTIDSKYVPSTFLARTVNAGDNCTNQTVTTPVFTTGSVSGSETGDTAPAIPSPDTGAGAGADTDTDTGAGAGADTDTGADTGKETPSEPPKNPYLTARAHCFVALLIAPKSNCLIVDEKGTKLLQVITASAYREAPAGVFYDSYPLNFKNLVNGEKCSYGQCHPGNNLDMAQYANFDASGNPTSIDKIAHYNIGSLYPTGFRIDARRGNATSVRVYDVGTGKYLFGY